MIELKSFSETEFNVYKSLFLGYCVLGGMPKLPYQPFFVIAKLIYT